MAGQRALVLQLARKQQRHLVAAGQGFVPREDAERFIEEVRGDDPEIAAEVRIEERELEAGGLN